MKQNEFKAWFDGFTEAMGGKVPTKAQWTRIKERVAEIDGHPVTERIFIDRYWPTYTYIQPYIHPYSVTPTVACGYKSTMTNTDTVYNYATSANAFNSTTAMYALGKADACA